VGERPLRQPDSSDNASAVSQPPPTPTAALIQAQVRFDEARHHEHWSRDSALRLYAESMALAWKSICSPLETGVSDPSGPGSGLARSLYNQALDRFLRIAGGHRFHPDAAWCADLQRRGIPVTIDRTPLVWDPDRFDELRFAGDYVVCGMDHYYGSN